MSTRTAYVWGPISNFSASLLSVLLEKNWQLHIASKSALQISLSPLDLASTAQHTIEKAAGGADKVKPYNENLLFLESDEPVRGTTYDIVLFMGLPSNFDEPRVSRAPWGADELSSIMGKLKGVPLVVLSSLWGGIQNDGVVPEEIEFERRKPHSHFEAVCQQYENRILKAISKHDGKWHLVRLPLILGSSHDGQSVNFTGLYKLMQELYLAKYQLLENNEKKILELKYNPDATFWMLPCDWAANLISKIIEDNSRPVICNVVSTQSTLNQEWMQELGQALNLDAINSVERDQLNLPAPLRSMLADNIQVKTRNLFEVLGRYNQSPMKLTSDYFSKILQEAQKQNWGQLRPSIPDAPFSADRAKTYFEEFLPAHLDKAMLKSLAKFSGGLAFQVADQDECNWLLRNENDKASIVSVDTDKHKPEVSFLINPHSFAKLSSGKMVLEQALLTRAVQVSGANPIQSIQACDFFRRFLRQNHFDPSAEIDEKVLEGAKIS